MQTYIAKKYPEYTTHLHVDPKINQLISTISQQVAEIERNKKLLAEVLHQSIKLI